MTTERERWNEVREKFNVAHGRASDAKKAMHDAYSELVVMCGHGTPQIEDHRWVPFDVAWGYCAEHNSLPVERPQLDKDAEIAELKKQIKRLEKKQ